MWARSALLIPSSPPKFLFSYTHGDVLFDYLVQVIAHGNDVAFLDEQLKLLAERLRDVRLDLRCALLASHAQRETPEIRRSRGRVTSKENGRRRRDSSLLVEEVSPDAGIVMRRLYV